MPVHVRVRCPDRQLLVLLLLYGHIFHNLNFTSLDTAAAISVQLDETLLDVKQLTDRDHVEAEELAFHKLKHVNLSVGTPFFHEAQVVGKTKLWYL